VSCDVTTPLDEEALARVDALARLHRISREQMIARIVRTGLLHEEREAREANAGRAGGAW
jgi:predicted transcriptional regulator